MSGLFPLRRLISFPLLIMRYWFRRYVRLIRWLNQPRKKQPYRHGIELELSMIGLLILIGIGHLVDFLRG
jgi:hypothetical protein